MDQVTVNYRPSWFVRLFHARPHWDIHFRKVNDTFNLKNELYLESLGLWASAPAVLVILGLLILLFYLLCYCCRGRRAKKRKFGFLKWVLVFFAVLCCGALACSMYGNDAIHTGVVDLVKNLEEISRRVSVARNQSLDVSGKLQKDVDPRLGLLREEFSRVVGGDKKVRTAVDEMAKNITQAEGSIGAVTQKIGHADKEYEDFAGVIGLIESIRWPVMMAVMGVLVLFCLVLLFGLAKRSRCMLLMFSALGLIATVLTGLAVCALFVVAMGLSDICMAPDDFVLAHLGPTPPAPILEFYIKCNPKAHNPFQTFLTDSMRATGNMQSSLNVVAEVAEHLDEETKRMHPQLQPNLVKLGQAVNATSQSIKKLTQALDCRTIYSNYIHVLENGCNRVMYGLTWTLLAVAAAWILFYLLVLLDSHLWIYMRKRGYLNMEEADPFLPQGHAVSAAVTRGGTLGSSGGAGSLGKRSNAAMTGSLGPNYRGRHYSNTHTPPQTPPFPSTLNGRMNLDNDPRYGGYVPGAPYHHQMHTLGGYHQAQHHQQPQAPPYELYSYDDQEDPPTSMTSFPTLPLTYHR